MLLIEKLQSLTDLDHEDGGSVAHEMQGLLENSLEVDEFRAVFRGEVIVEK